MSPLRQGRFLLLVLAVFISAMVVWNPLAGLSPEARGINLGTEFNGGKRAFFDTEASQVTIQVSDNDMSAAWASISQTLGRTFEVSLVSQDQESKQLVVNVAGTFGESYIQSQIGSRWEVLGVEAGIAPTALDSLISSVKARADPYGLLGVKVRSWGDTGFVVESPDSLLKSLLTTQGKVEVIVEGDVVATNSDITRMSMPSLVSQLARLPVYFLSASLENINVDISGMSGKAISLYVDRPSDAVIIFDNDFLSGLTDVTYDENSLSFIESTLDHPLAVTALESSMDNLSDFAREYLAANVLDKARVIVLTPSGQYSSDFENGIPSSFRIETPSRLQDETADLWLSRVCGLVAMTPISASMADNGISSGVVFAVTGTMETSALDLAKVMRTVTFAELPAKVSYDYEFSVDASYSPDFLKRVAIAYVVGIAVVFLLVSRRYKMFGISVGIVGITLCESLIALGVVSITQISFGFAELAGVLLVTVMGVCQLIMITDEMLVEVPKDKKVRVGWRAPQALGVARTAAVLEMGAAIVLGLVGPGVLHGFSVVVVGATLFSVLLTRSVYARLIDLVVSRGSGTK